MFFIVGNASIVRWKSCIEMICESIPAGSKSELAGEEERVE